MTPTDSPSSIVFLDELDPVRCPCGWARRAFGGLPGSPLSVHLVEIEDEAALHHHDHHTEVYYVLEADPSAQIEINGTRTPVRPGACIYIPPGVRHRALGPMKILNIVLPPFDPADEHLD